MRKTTIATLLAVVLSAAAISQAAEPTGTRGVNKHAPAQRPVALTASQYASIQAVQAAPEHAKVLKTSATYSAREESLKFTRFSDDMWTAIYQVGWPGSYLGVLLCAL